MSPSIAAVDSRYFKKISEWHGVAAEQVGEIFKIENSIAHNNIVEINKIFSQKPSWFPVDRSGFAKPLIKFYAQRPWQIPKQQKSLDQAFRERVHNLEKHNKTINIFWSGGIDSTTIVTAFLKHSKDLSQIRILYSPWSTYEHPDYMDFLKKFNNIELIDTSGTKYIDAQFDGIFITGHGGDELMASIDESFFTKYG